MQADYIVVKQNIFKFMYGLHGCPLMKTIDIERKYRLLKVCYAPATSTTYSKAFLQQPLTVLTR
jgi:hypothetical protein